MANLAGWPYWKVISITGQSGAGTDYQVKLTIGDSAGGDFHLEDHCTNFPQDLRITDDDGTTLLDHWVEDLTADPIIVHVEVKDDLGSNRDVRVYYGKSGETTASNIEDTFLLGDNFTISIDWTNKWQSTDQSLYSISGGNLVLNAASLVTKCFNSQNSFNNYIIESRHKVVGSSPCELHLEMSNAIATIPAKERASTRINDTFVAYINGAYNTNGTGTSGTWYRNKIVVPSSGNATASVSSDDLITTHVTKTGTPAYTTAYIALFQFSSNAGYIDWIFVRKYNDPEPAFSSAGAEQSAAGAPTGVFYGPLVGPFGGPI